MTAQSKFPGAIYWRTISLVASAILITGTLTTGCLAGPRAFVLRLQLAQPPLPVDPTPLDQLLTSAERAALSNARGLRKVSEIYLDLSDQHLRAAHTAITDGEPGVAERELDIYVKLIDRLSDVVSSSPKRDRDLGKRFEQRLYSQMGMLQAVERQFPADLVGYADAALEDAKKVRAHVLNETLGRGEVLSETDKRDGSAHAANKLAQDPPLRKRSVFAAVPSPAAPHQLPGDYLTEHELDRVKSAQEIDDRTKVFMQIADLRLSLLSPGGKSAAPDSAKKDSKGKGKDKDNDKGQKGPTDAELLGKLGRVELLHHYSRAIQEIMDKIDDAYDRNPRSGLLKKAVDILRDATDKQLMVLHSLESQMSTQDEKDAVKQAIADAEQANEGAKRGVPKDAIFSQPSQPYRPISLTKEQASNSSRISPSFPLVILTRI